MTVVKQVAIDLDNGKDYMRSFITGDDSESSPKDGASFNIRSNAELIVNVDAEQIHNLQYRLWVYRTRSWNEPALKLFLDYGKRYGSFDTEDKGEHSYKVTAQAKRTRDW